jgi:hypothetical protein
LYRQYLQGGPSSHDFDRNELLLERVRGLNELATLAITLANYMFGSSFTNCLPHLEGEEVFGSSKQFVDCPLSTDNDSHCHDHVNFSHPRVTIPVVEPNIVNDVQMQQPPSSSNKLLPLVS